VYVLLSLRCECMCVLYSLAAVFDTQGTFTDPFANRIRVGKDMASETLEAVLATTFAIAGGDDNPFIIPELKDFGPRLGRFQGKRPLPELHGLELRLLSTDEMHSRAFEAVKTGLLEAAFTQGTYYAVLVGVSGCGKTQTMFMLAGSYFAFIWTVICRARKGTLPRMTKIFAA